MRVVEYEDGVQDCSTHPNSRKLCVYQDKSYVFNGIESHILFRELIGYECAECGRALEPK